jgi:hypothetical protein
MAGDSLFATEPKKTVVIVPPRGHEVAQTVSVSSRPLTKGRFKRAATVVKVEGKVANYASGTTKSRERAGLTKDLFPARPKPKPVDPRPKVFARPDSAARQAGGPGPGMYEQFEEEMGHHPGLPPKAWRRDGLMQGTLLVDDDKLQHGREEHIERQDWRYDQIHGALRKAAKPPKIAKPAPRKPVPHADDVFTPQLFNPSQSVELAKGRIVSNDACMALLPASFNRTVNSSRHFPPGAAFIEVGLIEVGLIEVGVDPHGTTQVGVRDDGP